MSELDLAYTLVGLLAAIGGVWLKVRPALRRRAAADNAILGKGEVTDRSGRVMEPAQPGLVYLQQQTSERTTKLEDAVVEFRHAIGVYTEVLKRVDNVERDVQDLQKSARERVAIREESAAFLRLAADKDVIDVESDE